MLSDEELYSILTDLESDRIERTTSINDTEKFCKAICAFSNDFPKHRRPGYLLIGVDDNGKPSGLKATEQFLEQLGGIRADGNIQPMPMLTVQKYSRPEGDIIVVEVQPHDLPPIRYKGTIWIRVGPRRARASESEERILTERRASHNLPFDTRPCINCRLEDLAEDLFLITYRPNAVASDVLAENHRSIKEQLASLRFFHLEKDCATHAGAVLFAKDVLNWLPGAYVQYVEFDGISLSDDVKTERNFNGDLLTVLRELDAFLPSLIQSRPQERSALTENNVQAYPITALRELLMNAVLHRSYEANPPVRLYQFSDRIEIQNPGGLYNMATPENFPRQTDYRNPVIAEAMKTLGYVNRFGRGVIRAQEALKRNGNPAPEFTFEHMFFLATILRHA